MDYEREQITFEIKEHIGVLCVYHTGWKKELNLVSYGTVMHRSMISVTGIRIMRG